MLNKAGLDLIKKYEGCKLTAYRCPAGILTIGYGHTSAAGLPNVFPGMTITQEHADRILAHDVEDFAVAVARSVKPKLTDNQHSALTSFCYNVGIGAFQKSTLLKKLNAGRFADVPAELMKWTKAGGRELPGLVARRRAECALWRGVDEAFVPTPDRMPRLLDMPQPPKTMAQSKTGWAAVAVGGAGGLSAIKDAVTAANDVTSSAKDAAGNFSELLSVGPWVLVAVAIVAVCAFIWWDRRKKLIEEHV